MQFKKKFEQEQSLAGFEQDSAGLEQGYKGFEQGSANYLGSNRILQDSWLHAPVVFWIVRYMSEQSLESNRTPERSVHPGPLQSRHKSPCT